MRGLIIAAPASGSGKTLVTMGLLRALRNVGVAGAAAKVGPDYIDPAFHGRAAGRPCFNLDSWAMRPATLRAILVEMAPADLAIVEGVMGLFDGAAAGGRLDVGSTAELAAVTGWPVVLVVNAQGQGASVGALLRGFCSHRADVEIVGVVFNNVSSPRHAHILRLAAAEAAPRLAVLGAIPRDPRLRIESRHLGLQQAAELDDLDTTLDRLAEIVTREIDLDRVCALARPATVVAEPSEQPAIPPFGQRIALARDAAFSFHYAHMLAAWRHAGAEIALFSPLADEAPAADTDAVFLAGGYPELHGGALATCQGFMHGLRNAAARGAVIYGECGGYMVLGQAITDGDGATHEMAGLLPLTTSFAARKLHLGYRQILLASECPLGHEGRMFRGHEFHYVTVVAEGAERPLFTATDAAGDTLGAVGLSKGRVMGSFMHLIDTVD